MGCPWNLCNISTIIILKPHRYEFCIECKPTNRICQLYNRQVKIMIINGGTNILVGGVFLKCFSIVKNVLVAACLALRSLG